MEAKSRGSPEPGTITMAALHNLERWQAGTKTVSISLSHRPEQGNMYLACAPKLID